MLLKRVALALLIGGAIGFAPAAAAAQTLKTVDHEGPFGIAMGEPLADLGPVKMISPGYYEVLAPTRPNNVFNIVLVDVFPSLGVCQIQANAPPNKFDVNGSLARTTSDNLAQALTTKYGQPAKTNICNASSEECADSWTVLLNQRTARYGYSWYFGTTRSDRLKEIDLDVNAINAISTYVSLTYFSNDYDACQNAKKSASAGSL
jgi:hypothetical protein